MRVKPLTGQVLVEILPEETRSAGGVELPNVSLSPEAVQQSHRNPVKPAPWTGRVVAIGQWPALKNGMRLLPEYGVGARVVISRHAGIAMQRSVGEQFRMVPQDAVLAVLT